MSVDRCQCGVRLSLTRMKDSTGYMTNENCHPVLRLNLCIIFSVIFKRFYINNLSTLETGQKVPILERKSA